MAIPTNLKQALMAVGKKAWFIDHAWQDFDLSFPWSVERDYGALIVPNSAGQETPRGTVALPLGNFHHTLSLAVDDTADHLINATEINAVGFTISGLNASETAQVIFTDINNHHVTVEVTANGSYSANLSAL